MITIPQGYIVTSNEPIDKRLVMTKRQMRLVDDDLMPDVYFCICAEKEVRVADPTKPVHKIYMYNKVWPWEEWVYDEEGNRYPGTGRFRPYAGTFEDLDGIPYINGVKLSGSEGTGETYHLQDFLITSEGILIERNSEGHFAIIGAHIDNDTLAFFKDASEGPLGRMHVVFDNLMYAGEAIELNKEPGPKPTLNVLYDSETIHLNPDNRLEVRFDPNRALGLDLDCEGGTFFIRVDDQTITYKDGMLHGKPEPLMDGIATHIRYRTSEWDSEHIDLVYDSEKGLGVDAENQLFIKLNEDRALEFDDNGQIQTKLDSEQGLWFNNDGEVFIKLNGDQALEFNSEGYVQLKIENSEGLEFDEFGKLRIKLSESEGLEFKPNGDIRVKVDENSVYINSEGQLELRLNENHGIMVSEGLLYVKVDDNSIYINSETGNLELRWDENRGITVTSEGLLAAKVDGDTIHFNETTGVFELHLDSERGITTDSDGNIYIKVDDSTIHINSENGNLELHLDTDKGIDVDSEGNLFVRIDDSTIHFDSEGNLELHLNTEKGVDVDSEGRLFVRVDQNTIFFDSEGNLELHVNAGRGIGNDSEGLFVKVDGVSVVINSEGELSSAFNVNEALEMVITSEGPVANVLYDGRFNRSEGTIFLDSEHNCLWVNDVAYDGLHSPKGTLKDIIPENAGNPSVMDPRVKNKLVDHDEMTWMITGNNNTFRGSYDSEGGLEAAWPRGTAEKNDYAFVAVETQGSEGPIYYYDRYKCLGSEGAPGNDWEFEFRIATTGFTLDQWQAINSDIKNPDVVAWRDHRNAPITASEGSPNVYNITYDKYGHIRSASKYNPDWEQETTSQSDFIEHRPAIKRDTASSALTPDRNTGVRMNDIANNVASGNYALAEGGGTRATGTAAHAEGRSTQATNSYAHAEGLRSVASASASHAEGQDTAASAQNAHAEGEESTAQGRGSHAEGYQTRTSEGADYAHAEGIATVASGIASHAEGGHFGSGTTPIRGNIASGVSSHAEGVQTEASGKAAHTEGYKTIASGMYSHAEGSSTQATNAYSHAEGFTTTASGAGSHAEGGMNAGGVVYTSQASGMASHAEGASTASGMASHAEGCATIAAGTASHAEGYASKANSGSHAEGQSTLAEGDVSHAEGSDTKAIGSFSHAEGQLTTASGAAAHAEGRLTIASGDQSHAEGRGTHASSSFQHAQGRYNVIDSEGKYADIVGWGGSDAIRKNISSLTTGGDLHVFGKFYMQSSEDGTGGVELVPDLTDNEFKYLRVNSEGKQLEWAAIPAAAIPDWEQNNNSEGDFIKHKPAIIRDTSSSSLSPDRNTGVRLNNITGNVASGNYATAMGSATQATGFASVAEGDDSRAIGRRSHAEGYISFANSDSSHAEGFRTSATGQGSHAEGYQSTANGIGAHAEGGGSATANRAHAEGSSTTASGQNSHAEGRGSQATAEGAHAEGGYASGTGPIASGQASHAEGTGTASSGIASHAEGDTTTASGTDAHAEGYRTRSSGRASHAEGYSANAAGEGSHAEGSGLAKANYSHAEGYGTRAISGFSHAEGYMTLTSEGGEAHAEGYMTEARGAASHAEGNTTIARGVNAHAEGQNTTASGASAHAEGYQTATSANYSHAEGRQTMTRGMAAHAEGDQTKALGNSSHAEGYLTCTSEGALYGHAEGYKSTTAGKAAHAEGGIVLNSTDYISYASGDASHAEGIGIAHGGASHAEGGMDYVVDPDLGIVTILAGQTIAEGYGSHAEGFNTYAQGHNSHAEGRYSQSSGKASHAEGNGTTASGTYSHAEGEQTRAIEADSHAEGYLTSATNTGAHAEGYKSTASGIYSHAEGGYRLTSGADRANTASAEASHAEGAGTTASGTTSHAEGTLTTASGFASHAEGANTSSRVLGGHAEGYYTETANSTSSNYAGQHVQGKYNDTTKLTSYADVVGWGTSNTARKNISSLTTSGDLHLKKKLYINSKDDGTGGLQLVPALTQIGDVLKIKYMPSATSEGELEWGPGGGGGGLDGSVRPGRGITFDTGVDSEGNPVTYINANISLYSAGSGINISPAGVISTTAAAPSFSNILGQARDNTDLNAELTTIDTAITNLRTTKQDKLTAGNGITISGNVISSKLGAGDSTKIVNDKIEVKSPITGSNGILVTGGWNATGWNIAMDLGTSVTGTPTKPVPGSAISTYVTQNFKPLQTAVADPTAVGSSTQFISNISQDANGVITVTKKNLDLSSLNIGNGRLTFQVNGTSLGTFTANQATNKTINYTPSYNDLSDKPTIPAAAGNGTITLKNGNGTVSYGNFTVNQSTATTINIPTGTVVDIERW